MYISIIKKYIFSICLLLFSLFFLYKVKSILLPFFLGFLMAYCFKDIVAKYNKKLSRHNLSLIVIIAVSFIFVLIAIFIFPMIFSQLIGLTKYILSYLENIDLNNFYNKFQEIMQLIGIEDVKELRGYFTSISSILLKAIGNITNSFISSSFQVVNIFFMIFISPIIAFYFLRDWNKIFDFLLIECIPLEFRKNVNIVVDRIDNVLHHYVVGQFSVSLILGTFYSVLLFCIGLNYSFAIGLIAGFLTLLPYVGAFCGGLIALIFGYLQFGYLPTKLFEILFVFGIGQFLEGNFITPNLIGNKIKVHPLWLIFGILAGGALYGFWGIVASMPLAGVMGVIVRFYFEEKDRK